MLRTPLVNNVVSFTTQTVNGDYRIEVDTMYGTFSLRAPFTNTVFKISDGNDTIWYNIEDLVCTDALPSTFNEGNPQTAILVNP
jgi:hypothetical protein